MAKPERSTGRKSKYDYSEERLIPIAEECWSLAETARIAQIPVSTFRNGIEQYPNLKDKIHSALLDEPRSSDNPLPELIHKKLTHLGRNKRVDVEFLADHFDVSPKKVRSALEVLRGQGIRVPDEDDSPDHTISLLKLPPVKTTIHKSLLEGDEVRIGIVSDTHLSSNHQALEHLHVAYDWFEDKGITEVLHPGDWTAGRGVYRTQDSEIMNHTFESQVDYLVENYPRRKGIMTRGIGGNHDLEGDFGRIGADPVMALAMKRDDIDYLGPFSAWIELPNGANIHLLHAKGGASYAFSYKAQKLAEGYPQGAKPSILIPGHFHRSGHLDVRSIQVLFPGCFEWKTPLLERLGLTPSVGFWVLNLTLGEDGSLVRFAPEWFPFYHGRVVAQ